MGCTCIDDTCDGNHCTVCGGHMVDFYGNGQSRECEDCVGLEPAEKAAVSAAVKAVREKAFPVKTMDMSAKRDAGIKFCRDNLKALCVELQEWHDTGILCDGLLRKAARDYFDYATDNLGLAESYVESLAVELVAKS